MFYGEVTITNIEFLTIKINTILNTMNELLLICENITIPIKRLNCYFATVDIKNTNLLLYFYYCFHQCPLKQYLNFCNSS